MELISEASYLLEQGLLEVYYHDVPLSLELAYTFLDQAGIPLDKYIV